MIEVYDPVVPESVEGVLLTRDSLDWVVNWCKGGKYRDSVGVLGVEVPTLQGKKIAGFNQYVCRKRNGDFIILSSYDIETKYRRRK
jgi:hypothetical protein